MVGQAAQQVDPAPPGLLVAGEEGQPAGVVHPLHLPAVVDAEGDEHEVGLIALHVLLETRVSVGHSVTVDPGIDDLPGEIGMRLLDEGGKLGRPGFRFGQFPAERDRITEGDDARGLRVGRGQGAGLPVVCLGARPAADQPFQSDEQQNKEEKQENGVGHGFFHSMQAL